MIASLAASGIAVPKAQPGFEVIERGTRWPHFAIQAGAIENRRRRSILRWRAGPL